MVDSFSYWQGHHFNQYLAHQLFQELSHNHIDYSQWLPKHCLSAQELREILPPRREPQQQRPPAHLPQQFPFYNQELQQLGLRGQEPQRFWPFSPESRQFSPLYPQQPPFYNYEHQQLRTGGQGPQQFWHVSQERQQLPFYGQELQPLGPRRQEPERFRPLNPEARQFFPDDPQQLWPPGQRPPQQDQRPFRPRQILSYQMLPHYPHEG